MLRNKVPQITAVFWITKILTTGMGETLSDHLVTHTDPVLAVLATVVAFALALTAQFIVRRYVPWLYWSVVVLIGILGTMVADAVHTVLGVPYLVSTSTFLVALVVLFAVWRAVEGTVDVHEITTRRREAFYWGAVVVTFALGTAAGDLVASTFHLGYLTGGLVFVAAMAVTVGLRLGRILSAVPAFWVAYVLTRPLGASFADWGAVSTARGGLAFGTGPISAVLIAVIAVLVAGMSVTHARSEAARAGLAGRSRSTGAAPALPGEAFAQD